MARARDLWESLGVAFEKLNVSFLVGWAFTTLPRRLGYGSSAVLNVASAQSCVSPTRGSARTSTWARVP